MIDPTLTIKKAVFAALGSTLTVNGQTVNIYADAPQKAPNYFVWHDSIGYVDIGTKDTFIGQVDYEVTIVTKVDTGATSSLLLDSISTEVLTRLVSRGTGLTDATNTLSIYSVVLNDITSDKDMVGGELELYKKLRLTMICQEI